MLLRALNSCLQAQTSGLDDKTQQKKNWVLDIRKGRKKDSKDLEGNFLCFTVGSILLQVKTTFDKVCCQPGLLWPKEQIPKISAMNRR
ncbi:hypothetical protein LDENG_00277930 [Lucifuga dentata]|nr:hypothetical protein LDENG_00277930 [Lucifuga dentata]